jgi:hypothetical protein
MGGGGEEAVWTEAMEEILTAGSWLSYARYGYARWSGWSVRCCVINGCAVPLVLAADGDPAPTVDPLPFGAGGHL